MALIRLGIHKDYVPSWGIWEGVRDLVQNALDEDDKGNALSVHEYPKTNRISLINDGSILPLEALLIGFSTKANDTQSRGQYGEGLKLAMLALIREGVGVVIRSGGTTFKPIIAMDPQLNCETLCIKTSKTKDLGITDVMLENMSTAGWAECKKRFTRWAGFTDTVETAGGTLIRDDAAKGMVFVKGIYVCTLEGLKFGYDLKHCDLDRDRSIPMQWELEFQTSKIVEAAMLADKVTPDEAIELFTGGNVESRKFGSSFSIAPGSSALEKAILEKHPDVDAFEFEGDDLKAPEDLKVVRLPAAMRGPLADRLTSVKSVMSARSGMPTAIFTRKQLSETETRNLLLLEMFTLSKDDKILPVEMKDPVSTLPGDDEIAQVVVCRRLLRTDDGLVRVMQGLMEYGVASEDEVFATLLKVRSGHDAIDAEAAELRASIEREKIAWDDKRRQNVREAVAHIQRREETARQEIADKESDYLLEADRFLTKAKKRGEEILADSIVQAADFEVEAMDKLKAKLLESVVTESDVDDILANLGNM